MRFHDYAEAIQARLGHSSVTMTLDRYGHLMEGLNTDVAERLGALRQTACQTAWQRFGLREHQREGGRSNP